MKFKPRSGYQFFSTAQDQSGVVSTYVSMGIIGILGLISVSFALLMQTEYTQARDRQFNTQARIAAETAINDARQLVYKAIGNRLNLSQFIAAKDSNGDGVVDSSDTGVLATEINFYDASGDGVVDIIDDDILQKPYDTILIEEWYDCGGGSTVNQDGGFEGNLDGADSNIEYTCVEVDGRPVKLVYDTINRDRSENVLVQTRLLSGGVFSKSNVDKLVISWKGPGATSYFQTAATHQQQLYPENAWVQSAPMLRVQIIPLNTRDGWTRGELNESTRTYFLYPTQYDASGCIDSDARIALYSSWTAPATPTPSCPGATISQTDNNRIVNADCDGDIDERDCTVEISGFSGSSPTTYDINNAFRGIGNAVDGTCTNVTLTTESACRNGLDGFPPGDPMDTVDAETWSVPADDEMVYIVLIRSIYEDANLAISAYNSDSTCTPQPSCRILRFVNQQINVTSTGRAGGLTYRIREVIPIRPKYNRPEYAIDSAEHICKVLIGEPDTGVSYDHGSIAGSYSNPVTATLNQNADIAFCEGLHP